MEIRFARECEKDNIMEIWDYCFNDGPKFTDYYFNNKYKNYNTIVVEEEAEIVSSLQLNQYRIQLNNQIYNTSYVVGVSTLPEARGRGYMKYMMEFMLNELYNIANFLNHENKAKERYWKKLEILKMKRIEEFLMSDAEKDLF